MITADFIKRIDTARMRLLECITLDEVEKVFVESGICDYPSKITLLRCCMRIQKTDKIDNNTADEEAVYKADLAIFLTRKWRKDNLMRESVIPDSDSNLSGSTDKKQIRRNNASFDVETLCKEYNVSEKDYNSFKKFYEKNILSRIQKKYLAQLISVIEDMIDEKVQEQIADAKNKGQIRTTNRYKIILTEFKPDSGYGINAVRSICFPHGTVIFYDPTIDVDTIRSSIAHELGHLLLQYGVIHGQNKENYANLFAFFAITERYNLYVSEHL